MSLVGVIDQLIFKMQVVLSNSSILSFFSFYRDFFPDLLQVNESSLVDVTHEDAVAVLKRTKDRVVIVIARVGISYTDMAATPPPRYQDVLQSSK